MLISESYTKGCDPEVFLFDPKNQRVISSIGLIGGSKDMPMPIGAGCSVQEDNVTVEFNTPPCTSADEYIETIKYNLDYIQQRAVDMGLEVKIAASAIFDDDQLDNHQAQTFGCEPDFNAWAGGKRNPRPKADNANLRSCGGHIHVTLPDDVNPLEVVKAMDWFIGCQMVEFDEDKDRRKLYGKPGAYRKKVYGIEYRTASNAWIASPERIQWAWDQTDKAVNYVRNGGGFTEEQGKMIQQCINESDANTLEQLKKELPV